MSIPDLNRGLEKHTYRGAIYPLVTKNIILAQFVFEDLGLHAQKVHGSKLNYFSD